MNRIVIVLVVFGICVAGLGYYMGWFHVDSTKVDGQTQITLTVDQKKIQADEKRALEKVREVGHLSKD
jgi:hypothetical protein